jgi:hypothetical protein
MRTLAGAVVGPLGSVRSAGASVQSALPQTITVDWARNRATTSSAAESVNLFEAPSSRNY